MDVERSLISVAIREGKLQQVVTRGVEGQHFFGKVVGSEPAPGDVWDWVTTHMRRYRCAPSLDLLRGRWPGFVVLEVQDSFEAVLDRFVAVLKRRELIEKIRHLSDVADDWSLVGEAEVHLQAAATDLARLVPTSQVRRASDSLSRYELYKLRQRLGHAPGVSFALPDLDDLTYGVQSHEMAIIQGFLSVGKSSLVTAICADAYFLRGETPLFFSLEMDGEKLCNRWDAYAAGVSYRALKRMELSKEAEEAWYRVGERAADSKLEKDIIVIDDMYHPTIERIYSEMQRFSPAFGVVDTLDEVQAPSQFRTIWERQGHVARELKGIAMAMKMPMIGVAQAGREAEQEGARIGNIAGSIDIARKADIVVGLHSTPDMRAIKKMEVRALKLRDDPPGGTYHYFWDVDSMTYRPWRLEDAAPPVRAA